MKIQVPLVCIVIVTFLFAFGRAEATEGEYSTDPYLCVMPVPVSDTGGFGTPFRWGVSVQFMPDHDVPVVWQAGSGIPAYYFDRDGVLRPHPRPSVPSFLTPFFAGSNGNVFKSGHVFDRELGYFRPISEDEPHLRQEFDDLAEAYGSDPRVFGPGSPGYIERGQPAQYSISAYLPENAAGELTLSIEFVSPLGINMVDEIETEPSANNTQSIRILQSNDGLRLTNSEDTTLLLSARFARGFWRIQPLSNSDRFLVSDLHLRDAVLYIVDADMDVTVPSGAWRIGGIDTIVAMPERGEALVFGAGGAAWIRDRRVSGEYACSEQAPPPRAILSPLRPVEPRDVPEFLPTVFTALPGTDVQYRINVRGEFEWIRNGQAVIHARCPGIRGSHFVGQTGYVYDGCPEPISMNPHTGTIWLKGGHWILSDGSVIDSPYYSHPAAHPEWLSVPLIGGFLWDENDELVPIDPGLEHHLTDWLANRDRPWGHVWVELQRFRILLTVENYNWRYVDADLDLRVVSGHPGENDTRSHINLSDTIFDPGEGAYLVAMRRGLWAIEEGPVMRQVSCSPGCDIGRVSTLINHPSMEGQVLVGAHGGFFVYRPGEAIELERLAPAIETGSIRGLWRYEDSNMVVLEGDFGFFTWSQTDGLRLIDGISGLGFGRRPNIVYDEVSGEIMIDEHELHIIASD